jgi:hypothetical protein
VKLTPITDISLPIIDIRRILLDLICNCDFFDQPIIHFHMAYLGKIGVVKLIIVLAKITAK